MQFCFRNLFYELVHNFRNIVYLVWKAFTKEKYILDFLQSFVLEFYYLLSLITWEQEICPLLGKYWTFLGLAKSHIIFWLKTWYIHVFSQKIREIYVSERKKLVISALDAYISSFQQILRKLLPCSLQTLD